MKAYLIDPWSRTVTEVERTEDYRSIYPLISNEEAGIKVARFDLCRLDHGDGIYVDDEGLFNDAPVFMVGIQILKGRGLVCGSNLDGDDKEPWHPIEQIKKMIAFEIQPRSLVFASAAEIERQLA